MYQAHHREIEEESMHMHQRKRARGVKCARLSEEVGGGRGIGIGGGGVRRAYEIYSTCEALPSFRCCHLSGHCARKACIVLHEKNRAEAAA